MTTNGKADYLTRDTVLKLLTDAEVARVSTAETAQQLAEGDEYLDLDDPAKGIQQADGAAPPMKSALPRNAVHQDTWDSILKHLKSRTDS